MPSDRLRAGNDERNGYDEHELYIQNIYIGKRKGRFWELRPRGGVKRIKTYTNNHDHDKKEIE